MPCRTCRMRSVPRCCTQMLYLDIVQQGDLFRRASPCSCLFLLALADCADCAAVDSATKRAAAFKEELLLAAVKARGGHCRFCRNSRSATARWCPHLAKRPGRNRACALPGSAGSAASELPDCG